MQILNKGRLQCLIWKVSTGSATCCRRLGADAERREEEVTVLFRAEMSVEDASRPRAAGRNIRLLVAHRRDSAGQVSGVGGSPRVCFLSWASRRSAVSSAARRRQLYCRCTRLPQVYVNFSISRMQQRSDPEVPPPPPERVHSSPWRGFASFKFGAFRRFNVRTDRKTFRPNAIRFPLYYEVSASCCSSLVECVFISLTRSHLELLQLQMWSEWFQVLVQGQHVWMNRGVRTANAAEHDRSDPVRLGSDWRCVSAGRHGEVEMSSPYVWQDVGG